MNLPHKPLIIFNVAPTVKTQKKAPSATRNEINRNPPFLLACLLLTALLPGAAEGSPASRLCPVLMLETRASALLINAFSDASAGLLGMDSKKAVRDDPNRVSE